MWALYAFGWWIIAFILGVGLANLIFDSSPLEHTTFAILSGNGLLFFCVFIFNIIF